MSADAAAEPALLPLFAEPTDPSLAEVTAPIPDVGPGGGRAAALAFIVSEIARVNGRATAREGGLPRGAECLDESGLIDVAAIPDADPVTLDLIRSGKTLGCFEVDELPSGARAADASGEPCTSSPIYRTAWLKAHFPVEFLTGILECDPGGHSRHRLIAEATRMRIPLLPLDINESGWAYTVERIAKDVKGIRLALTEAIGMGADGISSILEARPFVSITDVAERTDLEPEIVLNLAGAGAFDSLVCDRSAKLPPDAEDASSRRRGEIIAFVRQLVARPRTASAKAAAIQSVLLGADDLGGAILRDPSLPAHAGAAGAAAVGGDGAPGRSDSGVHAGSAVNRTVGDHPVGNGPADVSAAGSFDADTVGQSVAGEHALDDLAAGVPRLTSVAGDLDARGDRTTVGSRDADRRAFGFDADEPEPLARFRSLLDELGATSADRALWSRPGTAVLIAGAGGPPLDESLADQLDEAAEIWSLDDGTETIDVVYVLGRGGDPDGLVIGSRPMLIRGRMRATDEGSIYAEAEEIVDLEQLWSDWQDSRVA